MADLNVSLILRAVDRLSAPLRRITGGVQTSGRAAETAQRQLDRVGQTQATVDGFRRLKTETEATGRRLQEAQNRVGALAREMRKSEQPTAAMRKAFEAAKREAGRLKDSHQQLERRTEEARRALQQAGISTRDLARHQRDLSRDAKQAADALERERQRLQRLDEAQKRYDQAREASGRLTGQLAMQGAAAAAAGFAMRPAIKAAGDFEHGLAEFGTVAGVTGGKLDSIRRTLLDTAGTVNQQAPALLEGLQILTGKGLDMERSIAAIGAIGKASTATGASIADLSTTAFTLIQTMNLSPDQLPRALDMLAQAAKEGGFEVKDMASYFPMLTASAKMLGMEGAEGVASLGAALQIALRGASDPSQAANNMANFLAKLTAPETVKNFEEMGVDIRDTMADAIAQGRNPVEEMLALIDELTAGDQFKMGELFGDMQVLNFIKPMLSDMEDYQRIKQASLTASGVVDEDFAIMMRTFNETTKAGAIAVGQLGESFGRALIPVLQPAVEGLTQLVRGVTWVVETFPNATAAVVGIASALMGLRIAITAFRLLSAYGAMLTALPGTIGAVASALTLLRGGMAALATRAIPAVIAGARAMTVALMANPIGIVVGGIALAAGLIVANWDSVGPWFGRMWESVKTFFSSASDHIKGLLSWTPLGLIVANWDTVGPWFGRMWEGVKSIFSGAWDHIKGLLSWTPLGFVIANWGNLGEAFGQVFETVKGVVGSAVDWIGEKLSGALGFVTSTMDKVTGAASWVADKLGIGGENAPAEPPVVQRSEAAQAGVRLAATASAVAASMAVAPAAAPAAPVTATPSMTFPIALTINGIVDKEAIIREATVRFERELRAKMRGALHD